MIKKIFINGFEIWVALISYLISYIFEIPMFFTIAFGICIASVLIRFIIGVYNLMNE